MKSHSAGDGHENIKLVQNEFDLIAILSKLIRLDNNVLEMTLFGNSVNSQIVRSVIGWSNQASVILMYFNFLLRTHHNHTKSPHSH